MNCLRVAVVGTVCAVVMCVAILSHAGPLNPPAGAVASSYKTLSEVEPRVAINATNTPGDANSVFKITQPGSYYLQGNVTGVVSKHGILITADNVIIDLNGFALIGVANSRDAINDSGGALLTGLTVRNGSVSGWTSGSALFAGNVAHVTVANLSVRKVLLEGIWAGNSARISGCAVTGARNGLRAGIGSFVQECRVVTTTEQGIDIGDDSHVERCQVRSAAQNGIRTGARSVITHCEVRSSALDNINAGGGTLVEACTANDSTGGRGIYVANNAIVSRCVTVANNKHGIEVSDRSEVSDCIARGNGQSGIRITYVGSVHGCVANSNSVCGILCDEGGFVTISENACSENGGGTQGAGIRVAGASGNRIENNNLLVNYRGIDALSGRNVIARNTAAGNSNADYSIVAGNTFGPVISAVGVGDVTGVAGADHPMANLRY